MPRTAVDGNGVGARIEAPEKCVGYEVQDPLGQRIGSVEKVFVNENAEPEYVRVTMGRFVRRSVLLPVDLVVVDWERRVLELG